MIVPASGPLGIKERFARLGRLLLLTLSFGWAGAACADDSLKDIFTPDEFRRAGLDKLSPEEQAALLGSLHARGLGSDRPAAPTAAANPASVRTPAPEKKPEGPPSEKKSLWVRIKDFGAEQLPSKGEKDEGEVTEVDAQLTEPFTGLDGKTRFVLDNGQVWQQRAGESYYLGKPIPNPKVTILRTRNGYRLKIPAVGPGFDVAIKRIK